MRYIGLDVHKDNITACVLTSTGKPKFEKNFIKDSESWNLDELMEYGDKDGFCVLMESGTYAYQPYRFFKDRGVDVDVVHAQALKVITKSDKKTDRKDAYTIGIYYRGCQLFSSFQLKSRSILPKNTASDHSEASS